MPVNDKRIDAYIEKAQPFARPILKHLRKLVHQGCPGVEETIKWSFPHFNYKGQMMCAMASFKEHCIFGFWKEKLLKDPNRFLKRRSADGGPAMGNLGRITSLRSMPPDRIILGFIRQAAVLNEKGIKISPMPRRGKTKLVIPNYIKRALQKNNKALETFTAFSYSNKKEYVEWITEAKTEKTRQARLSTAIQWMAEGKTRNWKYVKK